MSRQKAQAILKKWQESGKERMSSVVRFQLVQEGFNYCSKSQELLPLEEFYKADNDVGFMSVSKAHVGSATKKATPDDFLPESVIKDAWEASKWFNEQLETVEKAGAKRTPKALREAIEEYSDLVEYCKFCRWVAPKRK